MKLERWEQVEYLYHAALERSADERRAFLDAACESDQELRREIESLLAYDEPARQFLEALPDTIAAEMLAADEISLFVGSELSHYQILALLGRGGMGEVY